VVEEEDFLVLEGIQVDEVLIEILVNREMEVDLVVEVFKEDSKIVVEEEVVVEEEEVDLVEDLEEEILEKVDLEVEEDLEEILIHNERGFKLHKMLFRK
jgi:hypothetical protein